MSEALIVPGSTIEPAGNTLIERVGWNGVWAVSKFEDDEHFAAFLIGDAEPYEIVEARNVALTVGINELWRIFTGASANTFTQPNTQIGIGDSSTAAAASQTDLLASSNKTYQTLDVSGGLTVGANGGTTTTLVVKSTFGSSAANYAWNELVLKQVTSGICMNRAVASMGTKASGATWQAVLTATLG